MNQQINFLLARWLITFSPSRAESNKGTYVVTTLHYGVAIARSLAGSIGRSVNLGHSVVINSQSNRTVHGFPSILGRQA